jgi:hypothetical protein
VLLKGKQARVGFFALTFSLLTGQNYPPLTAAFMIKTVGVVALPP